MFIPGMLNIWLWGKISNPIPIQHEMFKELVKNSVKVPSPATDRLCAAARKAHAFVVMGICELDTLFSGTVYLTQLFISDTGEIMGVHRKMVPTREEKLVFSNGDSVTCTLLILLMANVRFRMRGANSLYKYALLAMGTQIHVASWPSNPRNLFPRSMLDTIDFRVRQFAHEGKIFVINSCGVTDEQNIEACCNTQEEENDIVVGSGDGSSIIGPNGEHLAGPMYEGEGILTAEISGRLPSGQAVAQRYGPLHAMGYLFT
ncbi:MAG: hypothetical protein HYX83_04560 [Chloroflexi bacterium]|nr:hypothetical protein [Chloroflexota bacterium]